MAEAKQYQRASSQEIHAAKLHEILATYDVENFLTNKSGAWWYHVRNKIKGRDQLLRIFSPAVSKRGRHDAVTISEDLLALNHRCLTRLIECGEYADPIKRKFLYFVVEDLYHPDDLIQKKPTKELMPVDDVVTVAADISAALAYLEAHELCHGQLVPNHVVLMKTGGARLLHPLVARLSTVPRERDEEQAKATVADFCQAPELRDNQTPTMQADIYALGAILFFLLTGKLPHAAKDTQNVGVLDAPDPRKLRPEAKQHFTSIIVHALQGDPTKRYSSAADLAEDLYELINGRKPKHALSAVGHVVQETRSFQKRQTERQKRKAQRESKKQEQEKEKKPFPWVPLALVGVALAVILAGFTLYGILRS